ncbi:hypothetical protein B0A49_07588 [Cryomyces minteri]|uniref:Elongator complex protein 6 n=1 Tax=Cryomyces minteri TaxID=331657 RepID=A0A4U0WQB0_9PEZI|nr:hypothetical protein B0A49_07588 [Cryomyces minteri]
MNTSRSRIPPLLEPYVRLPPEASLILVTSVLGASANWLVVRHICGALGSDGRKDGRVSAEDGEEIGPSNGDGNRVADEEVGVVLVSWMRDYRFWRAEARRGGGLDLERLMQQHRFAFVDGLTSLFSESAAPSPIPRPHPPASSLSSPTSVKQTSLPALQESRQLPSHPAVARPIHPHSQSQRAPSAPTPSTSSPSQTTGLSTLTSPDLPPTLRTIQAAIQTLSTRRTVLFLDDPALLLASTTATVQDLAAMIRSLRAPPNVHSTVIVAGADAPLLSFPFPSSPSSAASPLEQDHTAFVVGLAHQARCVMGVRRLGTGGARDVSGVVRITRGGDYIRVENEDEDVEVDEKELLYYVKGDGGVSVFERGGGGAG